jgi:hypothetical protein
MSRDLPNFPNLDHFRKQAKALHRQMRQDDPGVKLAAAQYRIARRYGFASWARLKARVESLPLRPNAPSAGGLFARFTERARRVVFFARYWAAQRGSESIETEHLLLGLIEEDGSRIGRLLGNESSRESIVSEIDLHTTRQERRSEGLSVPLTSESKRILELAAEAADQLGHTEIETRHILLGFLRAEDSLATSILMSVLKEGRRSRDAFRDDIIRSLNEEPL